MSHHPPMLAVKNLTKTFGTRAIIKRLSFSIPQGERVTIFAPSGSGKTTLITILSGLDSHFQGTFSLKARRPSTIFQEPRLFAYMTVEENIFFPFQVQNRPVSADVYARYQQWLEVCGLADYTRHYPYQVSGGMKQKVSLIRSFLMDPDFVMMDEPFKSIDLSSKQQIIRHIVRSYPQITLLLVTHNIEEVPLLTSSLLLFQTTVLDEFTTYADVAERPVTDIFSGMLRPLTDPAELPR